jgi:hypothetical protein
VENIIYGGDITRELHHVLSETLLSSTSKGIGDLDP